MRLTYCNIEGGNFGDDLNPWLWPQIAPGLCDDDPSAELLGIGSILANTYPDGPQRIVFGSGAGYKRPPIIDANWKIYCVRGPRTAMALKVDPQLAITDSAALVALLSWADCEKQHDVAYMPHHYSAELGDWRKVCQLAGIHYIDPSQHVADTIDQIRRTKLLITEALHGAVVADAFRVPWLPVRAYGHILPFKWHDWCESLELRYQPHRLPTLWQQPMPLAQRAKHLSKRLLGLLPGAKEKWRWSPVRCHGSDRVEQAADELSRLAQSQPTCISSDAVHNRVINRLADCLTKLKRDYGIVDDPTRQWAA